MAEGALAGLKVLDLSRVLAGPYCGQVLGDLGADVVKVESPAGDDTRQWGPPFLAEGEAAYFHAANRNKRSIMLDFTAADDLRRVKALAGRADVVIENFKRGGLAKFGLDAASLRAANPRLIYCSITGFGQTGPLADRPGYDFMIQGMGGLMSVTGEAGGQPMKTGVAVADLFTGLFAATAILAALNHRHATGEGQVIDCALLDAQAAMLANQASNWLNGGVCPGRMGNAHPNITPYQVFACADGHLIVAVGNDRQFTALCDALGLPPDPRFADNASRVRHRDALEAALAAPLGRLTRAEALARLERAGVPCGPINSVADVFAEPQLEARGAVTELTRQDGLVSRGVAYPPKLSASPASYRAAPPALDSGAASALSDWGVD